MNANGQSLKVLMENSVLEVPYFQRRYVWEENNFDELIKSIELAPVSRMPFMGCITLQDLKQKVNGLSKLSIIDGQQRLTTFSILLRAIFDSYDDWKTNTAIPHWSDIRNFLYIIESDPITSIDTYKIRLEPSRIDSKDFKAIMDPKRVGPLEIKWVGRGKNKKIESKMIYAYHYFLETIKNKTIGDSQYKKKITDKIMTGVKYFVEIILDSDDDAQQVFDSMNRLGVNLNSAEIVKNLIFQHLIETSKKEEIKKQNFQFNIQDIKEKVYKIFKEKWEDTFENEEKYKFWDEERGKGRFKCTNLEFFLKDYATIKSIYKSEKADVLSKLADNYTSYINKMNYDEMVKFLDDLIAYAETYRTCRKTLDEQTNLVRNDYFSCCNLLLDKTETSTFDPIILEIQHTFKNTDAEEQYNNKLFIIEKFVMSHLITGETTKNFNKNCQVGISKIKNHDEFIKYFESNIQETVNHDWSKVPDKLRDLTNRQSTIILFLIELIRRVNDSQHYDSDLNYNNFTLEHIMPKEWREKWSDVQAYNENGEPINLVKHQRDIAVGSIGNHTILPGRLNSTISNSDFITKLNGSSDGKYPGIKKYVNNVSLAKEIINLPLWDERNIYSREKQLYKTLVDFYEFRNRE